MHIFERKISKFPELKMRETMLLQDQRIGQLEDRVAKKDKEIEDLHHRIDTLQDELCDCNDRLPLAAQPSKANDGPQEKVSDSQLAGTEIKPNHDELEAEDISKGTCTCTKKPPLCCKLVLYGHMHLYSYMELYKKQTLEDHFKYTRPV